MLSRKFISKQRKMKKLLLLIIFLSCWTLLPAQVDEGEFVIIESEPEFEVELNLFSIQTKSFDIIKSSLEKKSNSYVTTLFSSKEIIPLYDLYCNWKFHLS